MVRKLAAALLGVGVFIPGLANALGLGEIKLNSALSEPLDAEIELVQVRELTSTEILPGLASNEDFNAAGVERYPFLTDLRFEVVIGDKGRSYIKVRSRKPIKEPFLNFLVEVNWPAGRLLREYTMLVDPPIYSAKKAEPVRQAQAAPAAAPRPAPAPVSQSQPASESPAAPAYTPAPADEVAEGGVHTINTNDSLWSIAQNLKPSSAVTVQQTMIALQRYNPDAFIDGNINLLRRGQVLRAPSEAQAQEISSRDAIEMVAEQNRLWRERIGRKTEAAPEAQQMDLSGRTADRPAPTDRVRDEGRLKLLAGSAATADSGQGGSEGGSGELRNKLAQAEENIDKFKLENEDLKVKMSDLQDQLQTSEKVLSLKDQQIAALQAKLAELESQEQAAAAAPAGEPAAAAPPADMAPVSAAVEEPAVEEPAVEEPVAETPAEPEVTPVSPDVDFNYQEETAAAAPDTAQPEQTEAPAEEMPVAEAPVAEPEVPEPALVMEESVEPVVQQPPAEVAPQPAPAQEQGLLSQLMSNPLYLGVGGGAIVLILAVVLMAARRKKQEESFDESIDEDFQLPEARNELRDDLDVDLGEPVQQAAEEEEAPAEETVPQTSDVLGEADIYIAYGRYPQAIEMLQKAAEKEPNRADIRMKLCEVCADAKEPQTFMTHYRALQALGATALLAKADALRARVAPDTSEDDNAFEQAFAEEAVSEPMDAAESFDFDISEDADATVVASSALDQEGDSGLDFDLGDLEDTGSSFASQADKVAPAAEAGLDFDLAFDTETPAPAQPARDDNSLDFDLDMGGADAFTAPSAQEESATEALDFDAEFSLDDVDTSVAKSSESTAAFDADLALDFDQMEAAPAAPVAEDNSLDFDLDFDVGAPATPVASAPAAEPESFDFEEDRTIAFTPSAPAPAAGDEPMLDSAAAAQLADELDFDVGLESASAGEDATVLSVPPVSAPAAPSAPVVTAAPMRPAANDFSSSAEDELDFLSDADETSTKLDLARAYIDMGDRDGARDILDEVIIEGSDNQKQEAKDLLMRLES